jgi:hypothetical protein
MVYKPLINPVVSLNITIAQPMQAEERKGIPLQP